MLFGLATPLKLLQERAPEFNARCARVNGENLNVSVEMRGASGRPGPIFNLTIQCEDGEIVVKEKPDVSGGRRLPAGCPERHINLDGTFCLFWQEQHDVVVTDATAAELWWTELYNFLRAQLYAERHRAWPKGAGRAHGNAARSEACIEEIAEKFGTDLLQGFRARRLRVRTLRLGKQRSLRLELDGHRVFAMWRGGSRIANLKAQCPCGSRLPIKICSDHADLAAKLIKSYVEMEEAEEAFDHWIREQQKECCGSMDQCPLRSAA